MRPLLLASLLAPLLTGVAALPTKDDVVSYSGYKVYRINTLGRTSAIQEKLSALPSYEQWHEEAGHLDIVVAPAVTAAFEGLDLDYHLMHQDLGTAIAAESASTKKPGRKRQDDPEDPLAWFATYHDYEDHVKYFRDLHDAFPNHSEIVSAGKSYEGRDIFGIHLWGADGPGKPAVLYHGTVHAREWIVAPVIEYITQQLIDGYKAGDEETQSFLDQYDYYIFPFVNPDGFVYTQTTDRLWRKNRQPPPGSSNATTPCRGRDINRNWEHGWDANPRGSSRDPCSETYRGARPGDAPENAALDAHLRRVRDAQGIKLYVDWHSYGQLLLFPFGYAETLYAPELGRWTKAASLVSNAVRDADEARRTTYTFGLSGATLYPTSGSGPDHAYAVGRAAWSYTVELPDTGGFGFVLPPDQIRPVAEEMWVGQKVLFSLLDETFFDGVGEAQMYQAAAAIS